VLAATADGELARADGAAEADVDAGADVDAAPPLVAVTELLAAQPASVSRAIAPAATVPRAIRNEPFTASPVPVPRSAVESGNCLTVFQTPFRGLRLVTFVTFWATGGPGWGVRMRNAVATVRTCAAGTLGGMSVESVFPQLEPLLPLIRKPVQYVGGEVNSTVKAWDETDVRWALLYPDAYEVGAPNQGIAILAPAPPSAPSAAGTPSAAAEDLPPPRTARTPARRLGRRSYW
jgi:hypothetical protein